MKIKYIKYSNGKKKKSIQSSKYFITKKKNVWQNKRNKMNIYYFYVFKFIYLDTAVNNILYTFGIKSTSGIKIFKKKFA